MMQRECCIINFPRLKCTWVGLTRGHIPKGLGTYVWARNGEGMLLQIHRETTTIN